ncbi:UNVERIFIED_ORG: Ser/Thr protein kinase RdoA (MazF antagonist) [Pseudomonas lini]
MTTAVEETPLAEVESLVLGSYGISARCTRISCERDELFHVFAVDGSQYILRMSNPADDHATIDMQIRALAWLAEHAPHIPVPLLIVSLKGETSFAAKVGDNPRRIIWMTSFLDGLALPKSASSDTQLRNIGISLAELGVALQGFNHPGAHRVLAWDIQQAAACREMLPSPPHADDDKPWNLVRDGFDHFDEVVYHQLLKLRSQVVHADFNPHNILMDGLSHDDVSGILDFGDMVSTQLINDIAIAASYHTDGEHPLSKVAEMLGAYHGVLPLLVEEVNLLYDLIITRLCTAITITEFRARLYPANRHYILKNTGVAWDGLLRLAQVSRSDAQSILRKACNLE